MTSASQLLAVLAERTTWMDEGYDFHIATRYRPFFISKASTKIWQDLTGKQVHFYPYKRVRTSSGLAFLVSVEDGYIVMSRIAGMKPSSPAFTAKYGFVVEESNVIYSVLHPGVLLQYQVDGGRIIDCTADNPDWPLVKSFKSACADWEFSEVFVDTLLEIATKQKATAKASKPAMQFSVDDFGGLLSPGEIIDRVVNSIRKWPGKVFFVLRGPYRGVLLHTETPDQVWILGTRIYKAKKQTSDLVCGEFDGDMDAEVAPKSHKTVYRVHKSQGFLVAAK